MFNSTFYGLFVQCLGKDGQGWWNAALGLPGLLLGPDGICDPYLRGEAVPQQSRGCSYALSHNLRFYLVVGGREGMS